MTRLGNHIRLQASKDLKPAVRAFYVDLLAGHKLPTPHEGIDAFRLADGSIIGVSYAESREEVLSEAHHLQGTWLEIMTDDVEGLKRALKESGVKEVEYPDKHHFYFQAPGGQVFRLAPESERNS